MILKASQRGGPRQLAAHLLNLADNDHVLVQEVRGFISTDLTAAMTETVAIARGTNCRQPVFSVSVNPPRNGNASLADMMQAIERIEQALGLSGQPRAIVVHEKEGRRHAHAIWSRINASEMKAVNLPFFKTKLKEISKELYLQHEWPLPEGHRTDGWKNPLNFTLAEWQQAKRAGLDPREIKQMFKEAWERSDGLSGFRYALEERGYYLAKGDRRGVIATDLQGEVYSVSRWVGVKTKELTQRLGKEPALPALAQVREELGKRTTKQLREFIAQDRDAKTREIKPHQDRLREIVKVQRRERLILKKAQEQRWSKESAERAGRFRRGLGIVLDVLTGHLFKQRKANEQDAYAAFIRDRTQRETLFAEQTKERLPVQKEIERVRKRHQEERRVMAARIASALAHMRHPERSAPQKTRENDLSL